MASSAPGMHRLASSRNASSSSSVNLQGQHSGKDQPTSTGAALKTLACFTCVGAAHNVSLKFENSVSPPSEHTMRQLCMLYTLPSNAPDWSRATEIIAVLQDAGGYDQGACLYRRTMSSTGQPRAEACSAQVARPGHLGDTTAHRCRSPLHTSQSTSSVFVCTPSASSAPVRRHLPFS